MVSSIFLVDRKTTLLSSPIYYPFHPHCHPSGCARELDRAVECGCHVNMRQSLSPLTWKQKQQ